MLNHQFLKDLKLPFFLRKRGRLAMLTLRDILYLQAECNYTIFYLQDGQKIMSSFNIKQYEDLENQHFVRTNRSYIINTFYVKDLDFENSNLVMTNGISIAISRRRKEYLRSKFLLNHCKLQD